MPENLYDQCPGFLKKFLNYVDTIQGKSKATTKEYFYDLRTFFRFLKMQNQPNNSDTDFSEIDISDVSIDLIRSVDLNVLYEYLGYVNRTRGNSASSRSRKIASLRSFFQYLHKKEHLIDRNPAADLDTPKLAKRQPKYLDLDSSIQLIEVADNERDYAILTLLLNCGMRVSELLSININDIRGDHLTVLGKGGKERTVYLNEACQNAISAYLQVRKKDHIQSREALFINFRDGGRLSRSGVHRMIKNYLKAAGLDDSKYSTHKLRHTAATLMYQYGHVDIRALQEILGHKNLSTTEIYTHLNQKQLKDAVESNPLSKIKPHHEE